MGTMPVSLQAADLDGDGDVDVAAADIGASVVRVLLNSGGVLTPATPIALGEAPFALAAGDMDRDGDIDLMAAVVQPPGIRILVNQGSMTFAMGGLLPTPVPPTDVAVADLDRDGYLDAMAILAQLDRVEVFLAGPSGLRLGTGFTTGDTPVGLSAWDADGDQEVDLVCSAYGDDTVSLLSNTGGGGFTAPIGLPASSLPRGIWAGDLTGDGVLDVVATNSGSGTVSIFRGLGVGIFATPENVVTGTTPYAVTGGDFDGNGRVDLAVVNRASGDLTFLWNGAPTDVTPDPNPALAAGFLGIGPNPFSEAVTIRLGVPAESPVALSVYDVAGRAVTRLLAGEITPAGTRTVVWDGRDGAGHRVGSGVYFLRLEAAGRHWSHRVLRLR